MPSQRHVCFLRKDEQAFSLALREKYPEILLWDDEYDRPSLTLRQTIDQSPALTVKGGLPDEGWEPTFAKVEGTNQWRRTNSLECSLTLVRRSMYFAVRTGQTDDELSFIHASSLQVHFDPPATKRQISFRNAVWRLVSKVATHRWQIVDLITRDVRHENHSSKQLWLGHHAVEWARKHPMRFFSAGSRSEQIRPVDHEA